MAASGGSEIRSTGGVMRALAAGYVGNFVEWYDFAIYSYSVTIIATLPWSFVVSAVVVIIVEIFPTRVRYSSASIGYNLGYMIIGGTAPIVATYLVSATGSNSAPAVYLIVVAVLVLPAVFMLPETRGLDLLRGADRAQPTESARPSAT